MIFQLPTLAFFTSGCFLNWTFHPCPSIRTQPFKVTFSCRSEFHPSRFSSTHLPSELASTKQGTGVALWPNTPKSHCQRLCCTKISPRSLDFPQSWLPSLLYSCSTILPSLVFAVCSSFHPNTLNIRVKSAWPTENMVWILISKE